MKAVFSALLIFCTLIAYSYWEYYSGLQILLHKDDGTNQLWIYQENNKRCLSFSKPPPTTIIQNCIYTNQPKKLLFEYQQNIATIVAATGKESPRILVIGLGGGTLISAIQNLTPKSAIDTVELNPLLPKIAAQYFHFKPRKSDRIIIENGINFVQNLPLDKKYDIIILDAFDKKYIPSGFLTTDFISQVKLHIEHDGFFLVNSFISQQHNSPESLLLRSIFNDIQIVPSHKNRIMIASDKNFDICHNIKQIPPLTYKTLKSHNATPDRVLMQLNCV